MGPWGEVSNDSQCLSPQAGTAAPSGPLPPPAAPSRRHHRRPAPGEGGPVLPGEPGGESSHPHPEPCPLYPPLPGRSPGLRGRAPHFRPCGLRPGSVRLHRLKGNLSREQPLFRDVQRHGKAALATQRDHRPSLSRVGTKADPGGASARINAPGSMPVSPGCPKTSAMSTACGTRSLDPRRRGY